MPDSLFRTEKLKHLRMRALVLFGLLVFASILLLFFYYVSLPYAGYELSGSKIGVVVANSPAESAGLRVGDRLLSVNGTEFPSGKASMERNQQFLEIVVSREGQTIPLNIALAPPSLATGIYHNSHFPIALMYWAVAMIMLFRRPRDSASQLFVLVCLIGTLGVVMWLLASLGIAWASMLMSAVVLAVGPAFVHYHTVFPEPINFRGKRELLASLYGVALVLLLLATGSDLIYYLQMDLNGYIPPGLGPVIKVFFSLCLFIGIVLLIRTCRMTQSKTTRRKVILVIISTAIAVIPLIALIVIPQIFSLQYTVPTWLVLLMLLFIPLGYLYGTYRHSLVELDPGVNRSVVTFVLSLIFAILYLGIRWLAPDIFSGPVTVADVFLVIGLVFLYEPLRKGIERFIDSILYGGWYEHDELVHRVSGALRDALDSQTVADLLVHDAASTMRFKEVVLLLPEVGDDEGALGVRAQKGFDTAVPIQRPSPLASFLLKVGEPVQHEALRERLRVDPVAQEEIAIWSQMGTQMWVPLVQQDKLMGILVLGNKVTDEFFTRQDHRALGTMAHQAAVTLARVQLVDRLQGKIHETRALAKQIVALQEKNQQRLAQELHDDTAHSLAFVLRLLEELVEVHAPKKVIGARDVLEQSLTRLRDIMFELRPPNLGDDLEKALEQYIASLRRRRDLLIAFHTNGNGVSVPKDVRIAVFRICQESLHNAWRHAQAEQIDVILDLQSDHVRLVVEDDGVGFEKPDHLGFLIDDQHLGLVGMQERAESVGGSFDLETAPGRGTRTLVEVRLSEPAA